MTSVKCAMSHTREARRSVHGEFAISGDAWAVTMGGVKLHKRNERVNPSTTDKNNSVRRDWAGTAGRLSIVAWITAYSVGVTPDIMKDGVRPNKEAIFEA